MEQTPTTTDHDVIRKWAEERGGKPARVKNSDKTGKGGGLLRIDFPGWSGAESLETITWEEWFAVFDERGLALVYQTTMEDGSPSRFNKIVSRSGKSQAKEKKNGSMGGGRRARNMPNSGNTPGGRKGKEKKLPRR